MKKTFRLFVLVLAPLLLASSSCQWMAEHKAAVGAITGAVVGTAVGAAIGNQSHNPATGAVIGGLVGTGLGAAIGSCIQQWQDSKTEHESRQHEISAQSSAELQQTQNVSAPAPEAPPQLEIFQRDSFLQPSDEFHPGDQLKAIIVFRGVVKTNTNRTICRQDVLNFYDPDKGEYKEVKKFDEDKTLPASGINENVTKFTIPAKAPKGTYQLVSKVYDPQDPSGQLSGEKNYTFKIVE